MSYQWLQMRISEEKDRRARRAEILERLPNALEELRRELTACVETYTQAFGSEAAEVHLDGSTIRVVTREEHEGQWQPGANIEIASFPSIPGFQIQREGQPYIIEVGLLPGNKVSFKDRDRDQYLTMEELTRRILDRAFFPKLGE